MYADVARVLHFTAGPFSQRVMLTLEEKHVPYRKNYLDEYDLPDWCVIGSAAAEAADWQISMTCSTSALLAIAISGRR